MKLKLNVVHAAVTATVDATIIVAVNHIRIAVVIVTQAVLLIVHPQIPMMMVLVAVAVEIQCVQIGLAQVSLMMVRYQH